MLLLLLLPVLVVVVVVVVAAGVIERGTAIFTLGTLLILVVAVVVVIVEVGPEILALFPPSKGLVVAVVYVEVVVAG